MQRLARTTIAITLLTCFNVWGHHYEDGTRIDASDTRIWHHHTTCHLKDDSSGGSQPHTDMDGNDVNDWHWHFHQGTTGYTWPDLKIHTSEKGKHDIKLIGTWGEHCLRTHQEWQSYPDHPAAPNIGDNSQVQDKQTLTADEIQAILDEEQRSRDELERRRLERERCLREGNCPEPQIDEVTDDETPEKDEPDIPIKQRLNPMVFTYEHTFPKGVSLQHIPLDTEIKYGDEVFDVLGDSIEWSITSRGISGWSYYKKNIDRHAGYIGKSIGFMTIMHEEKTIELSGTFHVWTGERPTYKIIHLRSGGLTLVGVPLQSKWLATVGDFYKRFRGITSVKGIAPEIDIEIKYGIPQITDDWFVELDDDVEIDGTTAYLIESEGSDEYAVWGFPWAYEPASAAPSVQWNHYKKMALTWGAVKTGLVKDIRELK